MATTVSVSEDTHRKMKKVKEKRKSKSFDELLDEIMEKELNIPDSLMGEAEFSGDKEDIRDRNDRSDRLKSERE